MTSRLSRLAQIVGNSGEYVRHEMAKSRQVLDPKAVPKVVSLHKFRMEKDLEKWVHGSDAATGGFSTSKFELAMDGRGARFHGNMSLRVKSEFEGMYRGGYAGIKTRTRTSLFGKIYENLSPYDYLGLRVKVGKSPNIRDGWYLNLRTANMSPNHIWQHRLFLRSRDEEFEELILPFNEFGFTASGNMIETVDEMNKENVDMLGISLLGGNAGLQGPYELTIDEIWASTDPSLTPSSS